MTHLEFLAYLCLLAGLGQIIVFTWHFFGDVPKKVERYADAVWVTVVMITLIAFILR